MTQDQQKKLDKQLYQAAGKGNVDTVKKLIDKGADITKENAAGVTPLDNAKNTRQQNMVEFLQKELNKQLFIAVSEGQIAKVKTLIDKGADITQENAAGVTPLDTAKKTGQKDLVTYLRNELVQVREEQFNQKQLFKAVSKGEKGKVNKLIDRGVDITKANTAGATVLHIAAMNEQVGMLKFLLRKFKKKGLDSKMVNQKNNVGELPSKYSDSPNIRDMLVPLEEKTAIKVATKRDKLKAFLTPKSTGRPNAAAISKVGPTATETLGARRMSLSKEKSNGRAMR